EVVVGTIGNDLKMDYTAVGQTTHLAARMEQAAIPGTVLISADTLRLAEGYVEAKSLGPLVIKGLGETVEVYEVTGAASVRSRFGAAAIRGLTRFVGRDAEVEQLHKALEQANNGQGQVVAVVGEPGVGKSRLLYEFTRSHRTQEWLILESGSSSYGKATPYLPLIELIKTYCQIEAGDDHRKIREKLTGKLFALDRALEPTLSAFLALVEVPVDDPQWNDFDPSQRRQRTLDAIKRLVLRESQVQPLLLIFEDLHWIDSETQAFLDSMIESLPTARILLLVNYRPEYEHGWGNKTYYSQLRIDPLPPVSAEELLSSVLGEASDLLPIKRLLIQRTEGNPFFLEESVRTLVETQALAGERGSYRLTKTVESIQVPATVQAVLAARIDRLSPEEKSLLQSASVIGDYVPFNLLQAIVEMPEAELRRCLGHLQAAEFLYEANVFPEIEYTFKHGLTYQVAYNSILQDRRRALHARIVDAVETLYRDRITEQIERLAHHALRGEVWQKAVTYLRQAGQKASARSANREATQYFQQALDALAHLPENHQTLEQAIAIRVDLGPPLRTIVNLPSPEVEQNYIQAQKLCQRIGETPQLFPVLWGLSRAYHSGRQLHKAREVGEQLISLAQSVQEPSLILEAHHTQWPTLVGLGELPSARKHIEQGQALYNPERHHQLTFLYGGHDPGVCCGAHAVEVWWLLGYPDQAKQRSQEVLSLARELAHPFSLAMALLWTAVVHQFRGEAETVRAHAEAGYSLGTEHGFPRWVGMGTLLRGWLSVEQGFVEQGIGQIQQGITQTNPEERQLFIAFLAEAHEKAGRPEEGLSIVTETLAQTRKTDLRFYEPELHRIKGALLLRKAVPDEGEAEGCFRTAIEVARSQSAKSLELRAVMSLSRLWRQQGKEKEARRLLAEIYGWFTEGFDTRDLKEAKALLEELS
ncbi:MAG TPA: AAA family ATPase, partial [Candidatus Binatia bacterium]|nr:AAA family ATPase [Candidatus Binatia bacterium]